MVPSKKSLLPSGFYDALPDKAEQELDLNYSMIKKLKSFGYGFVRPTIMEFEQSLDRSISSEFFKVTDPASGKMMVLRNDITPQIARIVIDRYQENLKQKLRLSYSGQVFRKSGKGKFAERQITQTGLELIGGTKPEDDVEIINNIFEILKLIKLKNYTIDFCIPNLAQNIIGEKDKPELNKILKAIEVKNLQYLRADKKTKILAEIISLCDEVSNIKEALNAIKKIVRILPKSLQGKGNILIYLENIFKILEEKPGNINISLNLLETKNFHYHEGICYSIIANDTLEEIARGGRYSIKQKDKNIPAVGATFILNALLRTI